MSRQRNITLPICATALYDQNVAAEFHEVDIAMILANIEYWVSVNELNEKDLDKPLHFHDGKWWTFGTIEFYQKYFSHLTYKQVKARLQKLEDCGYIVSGNFNKMKMDKTKWYTLSDEYRPKERPKWQPRTAAEKQRILVVTPKWEIARPKWANRVLLYERPKWAKQYHIEPIPI